MDLYHDGAAGRKTSNPFDLYRIGPECFRAAGGFGPVRLAELAAHGIRTASDRLDLGQRELQRIHGIGQTLAQRIVALRAMQ